jgi:sulfate permease, SulP family
MKTFFVDFAHRLTIDRKNIGSDLVAGLTLAIESIPDSMATALLAGISPLTGLYTMIVATPVGALFTGSVMMHIATTSAIALAVGSSLSSVPAESRLQAVFMLALMVGVIQIALGLLKMGSLVRFVPYSVMTGFLNGVAILIILGQVGDITGYSSDYSNKVMKTMDTALHAQEVILPILFVGLVTIALIVVLDRVRAVRKFSLVLAMVLASALAALPAFGMVPLVGDVTDVPNSLPEFSLPHLSLLWILLVPALSISIIGLVQGAGIGQSLPNPDGTFPDPSKDFFGQGMANAATGLFSGMPAGGSLSGTSLVISAGGKSRWANIFVGILIAVIILLFAGLVKLIAMPALAGLLIVVGFQTIKPANIVMVWQTGILPRTVMLITFVGTLIMPLQFAVLLGVAISIVLFLGQQANRVKVVELLPMPGGFPVERPAPRQLTSHKITVLYTYGSLFYAAAKTLEEDLPAAEGAKQAVVIFTLRGYQDFGSTLLGVLERYARAIQGNGGRLMLAGIGEEVREQMERTGFLDLIGHENAFMAEAQWGEAANKAYAAAQQWLSTADAPK